MKLGKSIKTYLQVAKDAFKRWFKKDPFSQSAVIAYYAIFSMPGLLVMVISIAALFLERETITGKINNQVTSLMGSDTATQVEHMIASASETKKSTLATIIGFLTVLIGASGVFVQLQKALNEIWEVEAKKGKAILSLVRQRLFSFGLIMSIGFLLLISLVVTTFLSAMSDWVKSNWPDAVLILFHILNFLVSFSVVVVLFGLMFKILPDAKISWRQVWVGSIVTAFLFILGKTAIGIYLSKTNPGSAYGAAGSIVLILLWVSYSSMIFFYGAEYTRAFADHHNDDVPASDFAEKKPQAENLKKK